MEAVIKMIKLYIADGYNHSKYIISYPEAIIVNV